MPDQHTPSVAGTVLPCLDAILEDAARDLARLQGLPPAEARREARLLAAQVLGVGRAWLAAHGDESPAPEPAAWLATALARRVAGEPVAYILGWREFYGRRFQVAPGVLIPRPETEHLVDAALARLPALPRTPPPGGEGPGERADLGEVPSNRMERPEMIIHVLDVGTGSGCIALTLALERPDCQVTAVDISPAALAIARANGQALGGRVEWLESDLCSALAGRRFHLIVSNPPYVAATDPHLKQGDLRHEPPGALASGPDGLDAIRRLVAQAPAHLEPGGWLLLEHGWDQGEAVPALLREAGYGEVFMLPDLAGQPRVSGGRRPGALDALT